MVNKKMLFLFVSIFPVIYLIYLFHQYLLGLFNVTQLKLSNNFFVLISGAGFIMLTNLLLVQQLKPKMAGFVFLAWSMLKIMLVLAYFAFFILPKNIQIQNSTIYDLLIIYVVFLVYEVAFSIKLIEK